MKHEKIAKRLHELGHSTRLNVYILLMKAGPEGLPVGILQLKLKIPASTLSHHLSRLRAVGLISQQRDGVKLYCQPNLNSLQEVIHYLQDKCCSDTGRTC